MNETPTILVLNAQDRAAYGAIVSLGRAGYSITAAIPEEGRDPPVTRSRYVTEIVRCPNAWRNQSNFVDWLSAQIDKNSEQLVLPISEAVIAAAAKLRRSGVPADRFVLPRDEHLSYTLSKYRATEAARDAGLAIPRTAFLCAPGTTEIFELGTDLAYPFLVKWDNFDDSEGHYQKGSNCIVQNREEFQDVLAELEPSRSGIIAQELIPGRGVGAFLLRHNNYVGLRFAHVRLHEVPWTGGVSSLNESSNDSRVLEMAERLLHRIGYVGVAMVEFRQTPAGVNVFLEINGRLWGSLALALHAGADFPRAMMECHCTGETSVSQPDLNRRIRSRDLALELNHIASVYRSKDDARPAFSRIRAVAELVVRTFDPWTKSASFWLDDPGPGALSYRRIVIDRLSVLKRRVRSWTVRRRESKRLNLLAIHTSRRIIDIQRERIDSILFLCYGNICRSPYAEARWNQLRRENADLPAAASAGFHPREKRSTPKRFEFAARRRGIDLSMHLSRAVTVAMVETADLIVVMDKGNVHEFISRFSAFTSKLILLGACTDPGTPEVLDPYARPLPSGALAYRQIDDALDALARAYTVSNESETVSAQVNQ